MSRLSLTESNLAVLVDTFYSRVRADPQLGPVFNQAIHDWPAHLATITDFWSSVSMGTGKYKGRPVPAHFKHRDRLSQELFSRWLFIWGQTTTEMMEDDIALLLQTKASNIAESLQYALFFTLRDYPKATA